MRTLTFGLCLTASVAIFTSSVMAKNIDGGPADVLPEAIAKAQAECRAQPYSMLITVRNIRDAKGFLTIDIHGDDPATFLKKGAKIGRVRVMAAKGETQACAPVPHAGLYGVGIYQDKNMNFSLDKGLLGIPAEPYGVSNDPPMRFGLPKFAESAVSNPAQLIAGDRRC
jgi:uncharacterized protein (DUF2141 family)